MKRKQGSAFITTRKGFCYLTVKVGRSNFNIMRIRNYTLDPQDKRDMRRLYPDYFFDWKKINQQLAEKEGGMQSLPLQASSAPEYWAHLSPVRHGVL